MFGGLDKADYKRVIQFVSPNRILRDVSAEEHRDQQLVSNIWQSIAEAFR